MRLGGRPPPVVQLEQRDTLADATAAPSANHLNVPNGATGQTWTTLLPDLMQLSERASMGFSVGLSRVQGPLVSAFAVTECRLRLCPPPRIAGRFHWLVWPSATERAHRSPDG